MDTLVNPTALESRARHLRQQARHHRVLYPAERHDLAREIVGYGRYGPIARASQIVRFSDKQDVRLHKCRKLESAGDYTAPRYLGVARKLCQAVETLRETSEGAVSLGYANAYFDNKPEIDCSPLTRALSWH